MSSIFFQLTDLGLAASDAQLLQSWLDAMTSQYEGYAPSEGNLEYVLAQIISQFGAELAQQASSGGTELFRVFGTDLLQLPYEIGASASAVVTITAADGVGHTLPAGSQLTLSLSGAPVGFQTVADLTLAPGVTSGQVTVASLTPGSVFNGAGAPAQMLSQIDWVSGVTVVAVASGGSDAEDDDHYLDRLKTTLQLLAPRPITAQDFATMALNFTPAGGTDQQEVGRSTAIDGYDPGAGTFNNEREVTVCVADSTGNPLNSDTLAAIATWLQSLREANFIVNVVNPNYSTVYVAAQIKVADGFDPTSVRTAVQTALLGYLTPQNFGLVPSSFAGWQNTLAIYRSKIIAITQSVGGVDHVESVALGLSSNPTNTTDDLVLPGIFPLATSSASSIPLSEITLIT